MSKKIEATLPKGIAASILILRRYKLRIAYSAMLLNKTAVPKILGL